MARWLASADRRSSGREPPRAQGDLVGMQQAAASPRQSPVDWPVASYSFTPDGQTLVVAEVDWSGHDAGPLCGSCQRPAADQHSTPQRLWPSRTTAECWRPAAWTECYTPGVDTLQEVAATRGHTDQVFGGAFLPMANTRNRIPETARSASGELPLSKRWCPCTGIR